ncbi:unnamed protein product [Larinioides sclopetarius]|uniref:Uncharacterized protein n=1 Tax=Larinioides sclopetarius TaxID=280406 RepID=A0AAV1Z3V8_9ARAC
MEEGGTVSIPIVFQAAEIYVPRISLEGKSTRLQIDFATLPSFLIGFQTEKKKEEGRK